MGILFLGFHSRKTQSFQKKLDTGFLLESMGRRLKSWFLQYRYNYWQCQRDVRTFVLQKIFTL
jgi:hypothetical protein